MRLCVRMLWVGALLALLPAVVWAAAGDTFRDFGPLERLREMVDVHADRIDYQEKDGRIVASGAVRLDVGERHLAADEVSVDLNAQTVVATGHVVFAVGTNRLSGDRIEYNYRTNQGVVINGRGLIEPGISVSGDEIRQEGEHVFSFINGRFTSCRACQPEPTSPWWEFRAEKGTMYQDDWIVADNATIYIKDIPVLYSPVIGLPIGPRRTGFLFPVVGWGSNGFTYKQPFFWAISRSQDMTVTPMYRTKRGFELDGEYRYVLDDRSSGSLRGQYWYDTQPQGAPNNRGIVHWMHDQAFSPEWTFKANAQYQSDTSITRAFNEIPSALSTQVLNDSNIFLTQNTPRYVFLSLLESTEYLNQTNVNRTWRVPEFRLQWLPAQVLNWPLMAEGESSAVLLQRTGTQGTGRLDIYPVAHLPLDVSPWLTATSSFAFRETAYTSSAQPGGQLNRFLVEAGETLSSRFLRRYDNPGFGFTRLTHVVEPTLQYLYIPWVKQQELSQFDRVDFVSGQNRVFFRFDNRLMAHRMEDGTPRSWEFARLGLAQSVNLSPTTREFSDVYLESLTPERVDQALKHVSQASVNDFRVGEEQTWSNFVVTSAVSPVPDFTLYNTVAAGTFQLNYNSNTQLVSTGNGKFNAQAINSGVTVNWTNELTTDFAYTFARGADANGIFLKGTWKPLPSIVVEYISRYSPERSTFNENGLILHYATCCWEVRLRWDNRNQGPGQSRSNTTTINFMLRSPTAPSPEAATTPAGATERRRLF